MKIIAYKKEAQTVVVIINPEAFTVKSVQLNGLTPNTAVVYTRNIYTHLEITNKTVEMDIPPSSITTFVLNN